MMKAGGNDVVLAPTVSTILWTAKLIFASFASSIANGSSFGFGHFVRALNALRSSIPFPVATSLSHSFIQRSLFREGMIRYLREVTSKCKPKAIVVCMIYVRFYYYYYYFFF